MEIQFDIITGASWFSWMRFLRERGEKKKTKTKPNPCVATPESFLSVWGDTFEFIE